MKSSQDYFGTLGASCGLLATFPIGRQASSAGKTNLVLVQNHLAIFSCCGFRKAKFKVLNLNEYNRNSSTLNNSLRKIQSFWHDYNLLKLTDI